MENNKKYKGLIIQGSIFPDKPILTNVETHFSKEMREEYIPLIETMGVPRGVKLLCIIMAQIEGFRPGTRSYITRNPGNIGNTDTGANKTLANLTDGIKLQIYYLSKIVAGTAKAYPMGKQINIEDWYSPEIAKNAKLYGLYPYYGSPGYSFVFTGQLDQFIKIYSTGARSSNVYLSVIISYFSQNGLLITPSTTLQEISKIV